MKRQQLKRFITSLLEEKDIAEIRLELVSFDRKLLLNPLISILCHTDDTIRWHGISILGEMVHDIASENVESARVVMRRFMWMLNDESGGIGWGVPEVMAESMYHNRILANEYLHMLISYTKDDGPELFQDGNFIELPLLQQGVLWGICRLADRYRQQVLGHGAAENLAVYLRSESSQVRALACRLCGLLRVPTHNSQIAELINDDSEMKLYDDYRIDGYTVGQMALEALALLNR